MKPATYSHTVTKSRPTIIRHDRFYPNGRIVTRLRLGTDPVAYIARCIEEDKQNRRAKVADYLAERAARPAPAAEQPDPNQMNLF